MSDAALKRIEKAIQRLSDQQDQICGKLETLEQQVASSGAGASREETIATYERLSGRTAEHVEYYEVLAGMRFTVILISLAKQFKHYEIMPKDVDFEINNPVANLHRKELEALGIL